MSQGYQALTEKEKQTLRLIVRGYDAKSLARQLDISVHTVNERLRRARRKMEVSSSREAARILLEEERPIPENLGYEDLGDAGPFSSPQTSSGPNGGAHARPRLAWIAGRTLTMSLIIATAALLFTNQATEPAAHNAAAASPETALSGEALDRVIEQSARQWLALVDEGDWDGSWTETGQAFKDLNTMATWARISDEVRPPLGTVVSRTLLSQESVPAPPSGYEMIKFRTEFTGKVGATETLTLARDGSDWRVVGYWVT